MNRRTKLLSRLVQVLANGLCEVTRVDRFSPEPQPIARGTLVVASSAGFFYGEHCRFNVAVYVRPLYWQDGRQRNGARVLDLLSGDVCDFDNERFEQLVFKHDNVRRYVLGDLVEEITARLEEAATR